MSADNRICIMQDDFGLWAVWMGSLSCEYHSPPSGAERFETKELAHREALRMAEDAVVLEGGIGEIGPEEQAEALAWELEDLSTRLRKLLRNGCQWEREGN